VLADFNDENLKREAARLNTAYAGKVLGIHCNVTKEKDVQSMIRKAAEFGGRMDLLFNNAGAGLSGSFDALTNEDWEKAFALNFYGALYGIRAVLPIMRQQGDGHIVNTISGIAFAPMAYQTMYAATKAALNGLTLALRYELWDEHIRLTSATPGTTITPIWADAPLPPGAQSAEQSAQTILAGVAKNERLVLGDAADVSGAKNCFNPDIADGMDEYLLNVARKRRGGEWVV
jgi:NAD(P)-dependent dehydrogenase (short-subunit alcohol dehydrogenase family)